MEIYDIIMLVILVGAVIFGAVKGMAWQIASIAALVVSYFVAVNFNEPVSQYIKVEAPLNKLAAMLLLYLGTSFAIWIMFGFVRRSLEKMSLKEFDRHAGALLGAITGVLLCVSVTLFSVTMLKEDQRQYIVRSKSGLYITQKINEFESVFPPAVHQVLEPYIKRLNEEVIRQGGERSNGQPGLSPPGTGGFETDPFQVFQPLGNGNNALPAIPNPFPNNFNNPASNHSGSGNFLPAGSRFPSNGQF